MTLPTGGTDGRLRFTFAALVVEIDAAMSMVKNFIEPSTFHALRQMKEDLESIWTAPAGTERRWELRNLLTIRSDGEYEPGKRAGKVSVVARISGVWDLVPIGGHSGKDRPKRIVEFNGIASTKIEILDADSQEVIAMWRMEMGTPGAPGCYFHVQVLGDLADPPYPKTLSVPRLPSIFGTPPGVIEFVLGELFQRRWHEAATENNGVVLRWGGLQRDRLARVLEWQAKVVRESGGSPWVTLKRAMPLADLFLT